MGSNPIPGIQCSRCINGYMATAVGTRFDSVIGSGDYHTGSIPVREHFFGGMTQLADVFGSNPKLSGFESLCHYYMGRCDKWRSQRAVNPSR